MRKRFWVAFVLIIVIPMAGWLLRPAPAADARVLADDAVDSSVTYSNILPADYVGPAACASCHKKNHDLWSHSPHSIMNQLPGAHSVQGNFKNQVLELPTGSVRFTTEDGSYFMTVKKDEQILRRYRVTRTVGTRYMQFYIGVQTEGPEPPESGLWREHMLPFSYWITIERWLPKHYFDPDGPQEIVDGVPRTEGIDKITDVRPYNAVCMNCHNTFPYAYRIYHDLFAGFPNATVASAMGPLSKALSDTVEVKATVKDFTALNGRLNPEKHLVTLGISCESCHFGGREHAQNGEKIHFLPTSKFLKITPKNDHALTDRRKDAGTINGICTQCHSGNALLYPNGASCSNSREGRDFNTGACSSQLSCVRCHEPHTAGPRSGGATDPAHLATCVECHGQFAGNEKAVAHGRHKLDQANCLDCHMPRQTLGLDALVRTHRVTKPVEESMAKAGSANACNLCHLDKSLAWTLGELERGWGKKTTPTKEWKSFTTLDQPVGEQWLKGDVAALRVMAGQSYSRSPLGKLMLPNLIRALGDEEPINRVFAQRAAETVLGRKLGRDEYDLTAPPGKRAIQIDVLLKAIGKEKRPDG
jgi:hypothetical protein